MNVAAVTVLYNTPSSYVEQLQKQLHDAQISTTFFIDNSGTDKGYAAGVNEVLQKNIDTFDVILVCNPDISLNGLTLQLIEESSKQFDIWGYGMKQDGKMYYGGELDPMRMSGGLISQKPDVRFNSTDFVSGSCMCISTSVIRNIGLLDESYFMYYEDVDYCFRASQAGFRIGVDCGFTYKHYEDSKKNAQKDRWLAKNRLKFLLRYGSLQQKLYELIRLPKTVIENRKHLF